MTLGPLVRASTGLATRDGAAYQLQGLGYSARETADVVSGRISREALDTALKMLMVGPRQGVGFQLSRRSVQARGGGAEAADRSCRA